MTIVYIHGASATSESFTRIREHIGGNDLVLEYNSDDGFDCNLSMMSKQLKKEKELFFIAHSLGGIYSLHLADIFSTKTSGAVTLSTPYGGSRHADYARYFLPWSRLMRDIGPTSEPMARVRNLKLHAPWTNVVTTQGASPWIAEPNDGVVTLDSMRFRTDMELVDLELNHYEVVISDKTIFIIKDRLQSI